jgi:hypothetical protein
MGSKPTEYVYKLSIKEHGAGVVVAKTSQPLGVSRREHMNISINQEQRSTEKFFNDRQ